MGAWLGCALGLTAVGLTAPAAGTASPRRNVLFIAVDDLRTELGCYGATHIASPNLDAFARSALVLDRAYCQQAVCSPSRTSLLTGARPDTTRVYDLDTHFRDTIPDVVTLPQQFKQAGYFTRGMGKIYHGGLDDARSWSVPWVAGGPSPEPRVPNVAGYFTPANIALLREAAKEAQTRRGALQRKLGRKLKHSEGARLRVRGPAFEAPDIADAQTHDGATARLAVDTLKELRGTPQPFFLAVGFSKPHLPFIAPKRYWDLYDPARIRLADNPHAPEGAPSWSLVNSGELRFYHGIPRGTEPIPDELARRLRHGYYACVSFLDAQVGLVLRALDELGLGDQTVVILWGDHGWKLGEHGQWCKHTNYENDARAPLLIRVPGMKAAGRHSIALVEFVDIYPTLCELCDVPLPPHLEGTSFAPLLTDPERPWKEAAFSQYPRAAGKKSLMGYALRTDHHRFVEWLPRNVPVADAPEGVVELYDHRVDPAENRNVADDPAHADVIRRLRTLLRQGWRAAAVGAGGAGRR